MAEEAISNFAQFEQAAGKQGASYTPPAEKAPAEPKSTPVETKSTQVEPEPAEAEAEPGETETEAPETETDEIERKPLGKSPTRKRTLSEEEARMLQRVTASRKELRELQQQIQQVRTGSNGTSTPAPAAQPGASTGQNGAPSATAGASEKPAKPPRLSSYKGTLEAWEDEQDKAWDANNDWWSGQIDKRMAQALANFQAQMQEQQTKAGYFGKLAEHMKAHPEYDAEINKTPVSDVMYNIVLKEGPQLAQALIDDKENARRISQLPPADQVYEMGKLAARLNGHAAAEPEEEAEPPKPVKIPARLSAVGGNASDEKKITLGAKNFAQYEAATERMGKRR